MRSIISASKCVNYWETKFCRDKQQVELGGTSYKRVTLKRHKEQGLNEPFCLQNLTASEGEETVDLHRGKLFCSYEALRPVQQNWSIPEKKRRERRFWQSGRSTAGWREQDCGVEKPFLTVDDPY